MYFIIISLLLANAPAYADVYKCVRDDASIYYQDTGCNSLDKQYKLLSCIDTVVKFPDKRQQQPVQKKPKKNSKKSPQLEAYKRRKSQAKKDKKREQLKQELAMIDSAYRHGYTAKRRELLDKRQRKYRQELRKID